MKDDTRQAFHDWMTIRKSKDDYLGNQLKLIDKLVAYSQEWVDLHGMNKLPENLPDFMNDMDADVDKTFKKAWEEFKRNNIYKAK